jgi:dihydroxyacid dehydratase/phosphogluconate dehydratase
MIWNGKELKTIGDLTDAIGSIAKTGSPAQAREFMVGYRQANEHADANVGYISGYFDRPTMNRIQEWFGVHHPVFGRTNPTPAEALRIGREMGERARRDMAHG